MKDTLGTAIDRYDNYQQKNALTTPLSQSKSELFNITDFYIGLFFNFMNLIDNVTETGNLDIYEYKKLARTLQKISVLTQNGTYTGIDSNDSLLYSASIYYLLGYKTNSYIITKFVEKESINNKESAFITGYLENRTKNNHLLLFIKSCFLNNEFDKLSDYVMKIDALLESDNISSPKEFIKYKVIKALLLHLINDNIWSILNLSSVQNKEIWRNLLKHYIRGKVRFELSKFQKCILKRSFSSNSNSVINFLSQSEKEETINILIYNHLSSNTKNKVLYVVEDSYKTDKVLSKIFNGIYIYTTMEEDLVNNSSKLYIIPIKLFSTLDFKNLHNFTLIIFSSFTQIGNSSYGIKYEYAIGKIINEYDSDIQIKLVDNDVLDFAYEKEYFTNNEDYVDSNRLINCYIDIQDKSIAVNIDSRTPVIQLDNVFFKKIKYLDKRKEKRTFSISKTHSNKNKSCKIAVQLLQKGNSVVLFTPQPYHPTLGVYELAEELRLILKGSGEGLINYEKDLDYIIKIYENNFGKEHLFSQLIRYGIVIFYSGMPIVIKDLIKFILEKQNIRLVISNISISDLNVFAKYDTMVIHMLRYNADFRTKPTQLAFDYWKDMSSEEVGTFIRKFLKDGTNNYKYVFMHNSKDIEIYRKAISNMAICSLKSGFEEVFNRIDMYKGLVGSIDSIFEGIDYTLLDMLINEVDIIGSSSRYFYSINDSNKEKILDVLKIRKDKLLNKWNKKEMIKVKRIGGNSSLYDTFSNIVGKNKERLSTMEINEFITEFIFELLEEHAETDFRITDINNNNLVNFKLNFNIIKEIIIEWISGKDYFEICASFSNIKMTVQELIFLINYFVDGYICQVLPMLISYLKNEEISLLFPVEHYNISLSIFRYGCNKDVAILLYELGLRDRSAINKLTQYILSNNILLNSEHKLLDYLKENSKAITDLFNDNYFTNYLDEFIN